MMSADLDFVFFASKSPRLHLQNPSWNTHFHQPNESVAGQANRSYYSDRKCVASGVHLFC